MDNEPCIDRGTGTPATEVLEAHIGMFSDSTMLDPLEIWATVAPPMEDMPDISSSMLQDSALVSQEDDETASGLVAALHDSGTISPLEADIEESEKLHLQ